MSAVEDVEKGGICTATTRKGFGSAIRENILTFLPNQQLITINNNI